MSDKEEFIATLTRGRSYTLGTNLAIHFLKGEDKPVTAAVKARLEAKAVDHINTGLDEDGFMETEPRCKFNFRKVGEEAAVASPRARGRRVHPA